MATASSSTSSPAPARARSRSRTCATGRRASTQTIEPHDLPVQFLTETGVVGLGLFLLAGARARLRARGAATGPELALALALPGVPPARAARHRLGLRRGLGAGVPRRGRARRATAHEAARGRTPPASSRRGRRARGRLSRSSPSGSATAGRARPRRRSARTPRTRSRSRSARGRSTRSSVEPLYAQALARVERARDRHARKGEAPHRGERRYGLLQQGDRAPAGERRGVVPARRASTSRRAAARGRRCPTFNRFTVLDRQEPGNAELRARAQAGELGQGRSAERASARRRSRRAGRRASALGRTPSSGPTTFTPRSCARRMPSARKPARYMTTLVA